MATLLSRKVVRILPDLINYHPMVIEIERAGVSIREKGRRTRYFFPWGKIYTEAAKLFAAGQLKERKQRRPAKRGLLGASK